MGSASVAIEFSFPDLLRALTDARPRIERTIASTIQTQVAFRFDAEGASNGHPRWDELKYRKGQILSKTGTLRNSISPPGADGNPGPQGFVTSSGDLSDLLTTVGTKVAYASVHDRGAKIQHPGTANGFGRKVKIRPHEIIIPERPFTDMNNLDHLELTETLTALITDILEKAT